MAPAISLGSPAGGKKASSGGVDEAELLRRRNAELEREVATLRSELGAARRRAEAAEEAEERLCAQLSDAEVEAVEIARAYQDQVEHLARELAAARAAAGSSPPPPPPLPPPQPRRGLMGFSSGTSRDATGAFSGMMEYVL
ncbi:hypothetical protein HU200_046605 [Digitaria exilis]|uniref:Uncharacterized protein n=1 Tax=Digitaria exilis TaxID=1010633 RepID=A0A835AWC0_9POAL|nr:hypothetical protein HU200_046605 [Digitaria exilis]CAB3445463.1 unnamed protein product [Digitaria exilis]